MEFGSVNNLEGIDFSLPPDHPLTSQVLHPIRRTGQTGALCVRRTRFGHRKRVPGRAGSGRERGGAAVQKAKVARERHGWPMHDTGATFAVEHSQPALVGGALRSANVRISCAHRAAV